MLCTLIFVCGQNLGQNFLQLHYIDVMILDFLLIFTLTLTDLTKNIKEI